jgi:hypothetical protein
VVRSESQVRALACAFAVLPADIAYTIAALAFRIVGMAAYVSAYLSVKYRRMVAVDRLTKSTKLIPDGHGGAAR